MNVPALLALILVAILPAACSSPCQELATQICACRQTETERNNCQAQAESELDKNGVTDDDETFCDTKLGTCDCRALDTPEGKRACGLAL